MKKLIFGIVNTIFGILWTIMSLSAAFGDDVDLVTAIIIIVVFTFPGVLWTIYGIKRIIHHKRTKNDIISDFIAKKGVAAITKNEDIPGYSPEDILIHWEITGREWERFKERKCTPEALNRTSSLYAVSTGIGAGAVMLLVFHNQPVSIMLGIAAIIGVLTAGISFFFIRKSEYNKYGFANTLRQGELTLTNEFANFCGRIIPLNIRNSEVFKGQIIEKNGFSYLFLRLWKRSFGTYKIVFYEFPIPADKLQEAEQILVI